jgi:predicted patatin/cPLA2 family phospholipase
VLRPSRFVDIKRIERDLEKIQEMYDLGQEDALKKMDALDVYLKG